MAAGFQFGVERLPIHNDVKNAALPFFQLCLDAEFFFDLRCETRSARQVISFTAVFDQNVHRVLPSRLPL
jgi:hypothetical protein